MATRGQQGRAYTSAELETLMRDAIGELMADGTPFRSLSVEKLVAAAGVARSTFYAAYVDKHALLNVLSAHTLERLYAGARLWIRRGAQVTREEIARGMRQILDAYLRDEPIMRAVIEAAAYEPVVRDAYVSAVEDFARAIERMLREPGMRAVDPAPTAAALAWMTERTVSRTTANATAQELQAAADALADVVYRTILDK